jgi:DNA-directed RNA polymerase subunit RPC12/RpoP
MITLEQHDRLISALAFHSGNEPRKNAIECPHCKSELYDSSPGVVLPSIPPQHNIHCDECNYRGYRI